MRAVIEVGPRSERPEMRSSVAAVSGGAGPSVAVPVGEGPARPDWRSWTAPEGADVQELAALVASATSSAADVRDSSATPEAGAGNWSSAQRCPEGRGPVCRAGRLAQPRDVAGPAADRLPAPLWIDGLTGLSLPLAKLAPSSPSLETSLLLSGLPSEALDLRHDRRPPEGATAPLGGALLARGAVAPGGGWGSTADASSRHRVASRSGAAPRAAPPVSVRRRSLLVLWAGAGVLVLASCGVPLAPVVRCVPGSVTMPCK